MQGGDETNLVVEDEALILRAVTPMPKVLGYSALSANSPGDAVRPAQVSDRPIHLLLTDVITPETNGRDLARRLTAIRTGLKVLFMSGYTANVIGTGGVLDPNVNFLQKPFSKRELGLKTRKVLDGGATGASG